MPRNVHTVILDCLQNFGLGLLSPTCCDDEKCEGIADLPLSIFSGSQSALKHATGEITT